jgi:hypothetical protein
MKNTNIESQATLGQLNSETPSIPQLLLVVTATRMGQVLVDEFRTTKMYAGEDTTVMSPVKIKSKSTSLERRKATAARG